MDDPGPSEKLDPQHLPYEDSPPPFGKLKEVILSGKKAADQRSTEAEILFGTVAKLLDLHCASNPHMPERQARALKLFCDELAEVTSKHFEAYVRDIPTTTLPNQSSPANSSPHDKSHGVRSVRSYAKAAKSSNPKIQSNIKSHAQNSTRHNTQREYSDDRLFLRLSNDNPLRAFSGFALLDYIKSKLGSDKELIENVLPTKTGFALCPSKGNLKALEEKISENKICADAPLEKASPWTSYRISNVPRSHGSVNENLEHVLVPVTSTSIPVAIASAAGANPVSITPSKDNAEFPDSPSTTWIVRFPEVHNPLPRVLFLFGCRTTTRVLPRRTTIPQCTRCWMWHNSRVCASPPRCRLCGSSQHSELEHANQCAAESGQICPPRCIHCHGPHPADDPKCELRPNPSKVPKTKTQITAIRQINAEARLRTQADAGCIKTAKNKLSSNAETKNLETVHNNTTSRGLANTATPSSPRVTRPVNLFEVLNRVVEPSAYQMEA